MTVAQPKEFHWNTAQNTKIYAVEWPAPKARAVIGLVHGIGEHCRRYDHMARFFQEQGIAVVGYDRQGYGRSEGRKGYVEKFSHYLDTLSRLVIECETRYPDRPIYLYGHSLGGCILLHYLIKRNPNIAGAITSAAYIRLGFPPPPITITLGKLMRRVWPTFTQSSSLDLNTLSRSPEIAAAYKADPLTHDRLSAHTGLDVLEAGDQLDAFTGAIKLPLLMMHGTADTITAFDGSSEFAARVSGKDVSFKAWEGLFHELHNEPEQQEVFQYVLAWLDQRIEHTNSERALKSI